ncbi:MAG TPA: inorganic phosphate transporter [Saprospiraceae bacterium]|nr:inorganic phosphate transporter [Lewinellaceae bacterium]HRX29501.1 inorganic phosphate transporter [Saprospiraceae bacterium]
MSGFFLIVVVVLFTLAIFDLIVGVSNDAVNFLNSAIGSKAGTIKTIMIVASLGIIVGAFSSSGMMEVARKGIFNPQHFYFNELMIIFLAVMLTDILLLDLFNTFALPTSTTVSIVFELLGAAVAVSLYKIISEGDSLTLMSQYINISNAIQIISGIFISILIAFVSGVLVQFIVRLIFSFNYRPKLRYFGAAFASLAFTVLSYFLLVKGLKGSPFIHSIRWLDLSSNYLVIYLFVIFFIISFILNNVLKKPILRYVVLFGTFSLAAAFAGNDLVNFIGVPIAGFQSYLSWVNSGIPADQYSMEFLSMQVPTPQYLLFAAGIIMVLTLWFNKKAKSVTETEVNLGRQEEGEERFSPNIVARFIVKAFAFVSDRTNAILPTRVKYIINRNFTNTNENGEDGAFDMIRATVNLVIASLLIAMATNLKLPLSTTYVSFMVAMGTSLSDRAWGRESAVYRIAGVGSVIAGWFLTAFMAFSVSAVFAVLLFLFPKIVLSLLILTTMFILIRTHSIHKKSEVKKNKVHKYANLINYEMPDAIYNFNSQLAEMHEELIGIYSKAFDAITTNEQKPIKKALENFENLKDEYAALKQELFKILKKNKHDSAEIGTFFIYSVDHLQELVESTETLTKTINLHIENSHKKLKISQIERLTALKKSTVAFLTSMIEILKNSDQMDLNQIVQNKKEVIRNVDDIISFQVGGIAEKHFGYKNSNTVLSLALENKNIVVISTGFIDKTSKVLEKLK